jgi:hypothetical protein
MPNARSEIVTRTAGAILMFSWLSALAGPDALAASQPGCRETHRIVIDRAWSGAPTDFAGIFRAGFVFVSYYDAARQLVAAKYDAAGALLEKANLGEVFAGWDAHNGIEIESDRGGHLHLAGNMHASPLVYFRSSTPYSATGLKRVAGMVGRDEARVTYPRFLRRGDELLFSYRAGAPGDGRWLLNRLRGSRWTRVGALFADRDPAGRVSAYPTRLLPDGTGSYGVAFVWRRGLDAALNTALCFARTQDFSTWHSLGGRRMRAPLRPSCPDPIETPGPDSGLGNTPVLLFDGTGRPMVLYTMLDARRHNQVYLAIGVNGVWRKTALTQWTSFYDYRGKGSLPVPFAMAAATDMRRSKLFVSVRHDLFGRAQFIVDLSTLDVTRVEQEGNEGTTTSPMAPRMRDRMLPINDETGNRRAWLSWSSLRSNNDLPRNCAGDCAEYTSDLVLHLPQCGDN